MPQAYTIALPILGIGGGGGGSKAGKAATVSLGTTWSGSDPYTQSITSSFTTTAKTVVDIQPDPDIVAQLINDGVSEMLIKNDGGTLTAYSFGGAPSTSLTLPVIYSEVI